MSKISKRMYSLMDEIAHEIDQHNDAISTLELELEKLREFKPRVFRVLKTIEIKDFKLFDKDEILIEAEPDAFLPERLIDSMEACTIDIRIFGDKLDTVLEEITDGD